MDFDCFGDAKTDEWARSHLQELLKLPPRSLAACVSERAEIDAARPDHLRAASQAFFLRAVSNVVSSLGKQSLTWSDSRLNLEDRSALLSHAAAARSAGRSDTCRKPGQRAPPLAVEIRTVVPGNGSVDVDTADIVGKNAAPDEDWRRIIDVVMESASRGSTGTTRSFASLLNGMFSVLRTLWRTFTSLYDGSSAHQEGTIMPVLSWDTLASYASPSGVGLQSWQCSVHRLERDLIAVLRDDMWLAHHAAIAAGAPTWDESNRSGGAAPFAVRDAPTSATQLRPLLQSACWYLDSTDSWAQIHTTWPHPVSARGMAATAYLQCQLAKQAAVEASVRALQVKRKTLAARPGSDGPHTLRLPLPEEQCVHASPDDDSAKVPVWPSVLSSDAGPWIGAEGALWSEEADAVSLDCRVWPRAIVQLEAAWSQSLTYNRYALALQVCAQVILCV